MTRVGVRTVGTARGLVSGVLSLLLVGCVAPTPDAGAFRENARSALSSSVSNARTTVLALRAGADGKATNAYTDTVVTEAEMGIGPIEASFGTVDPPGPGDDELRARVMAMLGDTSDALATARIAVRRDDHAQMRVSADELSRLAAEMDTAQQALQ